MGARRLRQSRRSCESKGCSRALFPSSRWWVAVCATVLWIPASRGMGRQLASRMLRVQSSQRQRLQQDASVPDWNLQQLQYEYSLYGPWDAANSTVEQLKQQSIQVIETEFHFESPSSSVNKTWVQISNKNAQTLIQRCYDKSGPEDGPSSGDCHRIVTTLTAKVDSSLDPQLVEQAALGSVRTFLTNYNSQQTDVFVQYIFPMFVTTVVRVTAIGLSSTMNLKRQNLFLDVFQKGFKVLMSSSNTDPSLTLRNATVLYQVVLPSSSSSSSPSGLNDSRQRYVQSSSSTTDDDSNSNSNSTTQSDSSSSSLSVSLSIQAMCGTAACTSQYLQDFVMHEGNQFGHAWVQGIQQQTQQQSNRMMANYFDSLTQILFSTTVLDVDLPPDSSDYQPDDSQTTNPMWLWIVLGVDGLIWLLALLWVLLRLRKRNRRLDNLRDKQRSKPLEEQYPVEPNAAPNRQVNNNAKESFKDEPSESHGESSDRIFDDGIRIRQVVFEDECDASWNGAPSDNKDDSERIFDDGIRVRQVEPDDPEDDDVRRHQLTSSDAQESSYGMPRVHDDGIRIREINEAPLPASNPNPDGTSHNSNAGQPHYDDGVRVSTEQGGQTTRIHDDGIHISNSIQDID